MDHAKGVAWYEAAAHQGHLVAQYNLAVMLSKGQGCKVDLEKAFDWLLQAAEQGMPEAQVALGDALRAGSGVTSDVAAATGWYQKAAEQKNNAAIRRLQLLGGSG